MSKNTYLFFASILFLSFGCNSNATNDNAENKKTETKEISETSSTKESTTETVDIVKETTTEQEASSIQEVEQSTKDIPEDTDPVESATAKKSYLILQSTTSYSAAMNTARRASEELGAKLNLRGYVFDFKAGLRATEACGCGEMHEYTARGRYDDGNYVSIEHSSGIEGFEDGLYIVVAGSGDRNTLKPIEKKAQAFYPDAYIKDAEVYMGCMH